MNRERAVISDLVSTQPPTVILIKPQSHHISSLLKTLPWCPFSPNIKTQILTQIASPHDTAYLLALASYYSSTLDSRHSGPHAFALNSHALTSRPLHLLFFCRDCSSLSYLHTRSLTSFRPSSQAWPTPITIPILGTCYASYLLYSSLYHIPPSNLQYTPLFFFPQDLFRI